MSLKKRLVAAVFLFSLVIGGLFSVVADNDVMTVEANIIKAAGNEEIIRVQVPDYLFFGNVSIGEKSEELKVYVNNTGNVDIKVKPRLTNSAEKIFNNLYFRKFKTSNGTAVAFTRIGDFQLDIDKPSSGQDYNDEYFYIILDLTNYTETINDNIMGHKADVKFYAVAA